MNGNEFYLLVGLIFVFQFLTLVVLAILKGRIDGVIRWIKEANELFKELVEERVKQ